MRFPYLTSIYRHLIIIGRSLLQSRNNKNGYIISQLPLKNTIVDFWRLIYDHGSNVILSLNALDEDQEVTVSFLCACSAFFFHLDGV